MSKTRTEAVDHPAHYNANPSGVECIVVVEHMTFNAGNAVKYLWRAGLKGAGDGQRAKHLEDLKKERLVHPARDRTTHEGGYLKTTILDHGYIELVEHWGSDEQIIRSARMSTDKGFLGWGAPDKPGDEKLLAFLYKNKHSTPFEFAGMTIEVQAPIFVFREWHRHRTQSYSELSARYTPMADLNYVPSVERLMLSGGANKQARGAGDTELTTVAAESFRAALADSYALAEESYQPALTTGVPKELARLCVPVGRYSRMRATTDLRNWLAFLTLRMAPNAQWEIRQYANAVGDLIAQAFPRTWALFNEQAP